MKKLVTALLLITLIAIIQTGSAVSDTVSFAAKLQQLETQLQSQLERIKYARELADQSKSLAQMRIARELSRSEAEMERQIEILERLKEQMQDQIGESPSSFAAVTESWNKTLQAAIAGLVQKIQATNLLLNRMESFREQIEKGSEDDAASDSMLGDQRSAASASVGPFDSPSLPSCAGQGTCPGPSVPTPPSTCPLERSWNFR